MKQISITDLKANTGLYVNMAQDQDVIITRNGKAIAKLVTIKPNKKASWEHVKGLFGGMTFTDEDVARAREERLR
ncbi:MAG: type II toxin-antitoxin system prevent-host-death family antitoxin [Oscillospiraceae bacterium]|nr:type II toxin-antitoxin system prevent-host-death family antitoxin [Ruminococcus sp.]MCD8344880.1 type II toxin-antitoxin system prevent-host-death family antitoxin [Oscillospiraceae bacterium]